MLPTWNPERLKPMIPFVIGLIGNRRSGKSTMQSWLLTNVLQNEFDLYISFAGSISCSPETRKFFYSHAMEDMMFDRLRIKFLQTLMRQQEYIKENRLKRRRVLLLLDDAELDKSEESFLGTFCTRARHFDCSIIQSSVSYTMMKPNFRRSLDCLCLFSIGMYSDRYLMLKEFSRNPKLSHYAMQELEKYQCLVQEKDHLSELFYFKLENESIQSKSENTTALAVNETENHASHSLGLETLHSDDNLGDFESKNEFLTV